MNKQLIKWYKRFEYFMCDNKFEKTNPNSCVFVKKHYSGDFHYFFVLY
jgi:choline kinase